MSSFIKCQYEECNNITTDYQSEYGAYCYKHNQLTLCNPSRANFEYLASSYPRVKTPTRRPLSPKNIDSEKAINQTINCMLCEITKPINNKMKCGHFICKDCIECMKSMKCPACGKNMEGPIIKPEIKKMIEKRMFENNLKEVSNIYKIKEDTEELEL
jgi:hypothetical protein